jgi:hypothetical protein
MGQAKLKGANREERAAALFASYSAIPMTCERYSAFVAWTRSPLATFVGEELEFFSTLDEQVIGVLVRDRTDGDYGYVSLGRDKKQRFRCIDVKVSMTRNDARRALLASLKEHLEHGVKAFPQGDEADDKAGVDLFTPVVPEEKLNPTFKLFHSSDHWLPARSIMSEMMHHFRDVDGNFVEQFQTGGYDARIWELYLYAALLEEGLFVEKPDPAPDFMVAMGNQRVFIEAVTVNPSGNEPPPKPDDEPIVRTADEIRKLNETKIPIKFGGPLWSKLTRKKPYWEMPDVAGHPLVFAIADFHEKQSMTWTSTGLMSYLYGVTHDFSTDEHGQLIISPIKVEMHEYEGKQIPSGFFRLPNSENVSAILFSASGTISKFNRMGRLAGFGRPDQLIMRAGFKHRHDNNSALPEFFSVEIAPGKTTETWVEGLSMFHNPRAKYPVDRSMFPNFAHHYFADGQIISYLPEFHPYSSYTWNILPMRVGAEPSGRSVAS